MESLLAILLWEILPDLQYLTKILVALAAARKTRGNLNNIIMLHYEVGFGVTAGGSYFNPNTVCS